MPIGRPLSLGGIWLNKIVSIADLNEITKKAIAKTLHLSLAPFGHTKD